MSWWTVAWLAWGLYFATVEGVALANSRSGDTLSEHVWLFLGLRRKAIAGRPATTWTRVRRIAVGLFMLALSVHFLIGSDRIGNAALIVSAVALAIVAIAAFITNAIRRYRRAGSVTSPQDPNKGQSDEAVDQGSP